MNAKGFKDLVERRICTPRQEAVQLSYTDELRIDRAKRFDRYLDEQEQVGILALGGSSDALLDVVLDDVDTLTKRQNSVQHFGV